jgi:hypothetical protein
MVWEPRTYRQLVEPSGLVTFEVRDGETDVQVSASCELSAEAAAVVRAVREPLEAYVAAHPAFAESFVPVAVEPGAPEIVRAMAAGARAAGVGPMAAVAGAVAERVATALAAHSRDVIVENGGDIYLVGTARRQVLLDAGDSPLSRTVALVLESETLPTAVCTSSGKVGHSVSLGTAHAVTVVAPDGALADAAATALGNLVHGPDDIARALDRAAAIPGLTGVVAIAGDRIGAWGAIVLAGTRG